jgi:hypothetical protein
MERKVERERKRKLKEGSIARDTAFFTKRK